MPHRTLVLLTVLVAAAIITMLLLWPLRLEMPPTYEP